ncbi:hypothetical protein N5T80_10510 [Aliarcobacter cryaerophilus]|jgi:hypothetical protein|uniref:hypothetical protein n=1 Tax=Aliarcobacter cryaerophilus TaxID=28198 RepID=UPI001B522171|nr:hypothetical protein [Aliarcobacter cryaerophilus]MBP6715074.1 hypothetical protein [Aliarcobacter sp.]MCT7546751.1 hypothetical protein [Aliarcobacter cryaerophilus]
MSVYAFVQSPKNDGFDFMVKNGVLIEDLDEAHKYINKIDNFFKIASNQERPTYMKNGNQHIFVGFHKERDEGNRRREFLLSWNTTDSKEMILETAKKIGITDEFDYDSLEQNKSKPNLLFYILIIAVVMILYKLFQK